MSEWGERMAFMHKAVQSTEEIVFSFNVLIQSPNISMELAAHMLFSQDSGGTRFRRQLSLIPIKELNAEEWS